MRNWPTSKVAIINENANMNTTSILQTYRTFSACLNCGSYFDKCWMTTLLRVCRLFDAAYRNVILIAPLKKNIGFYSQTLYFMLSFSSLFVRAVNHITAWGKRERRQWHAWTVVVDYYIYFIIIFSPYFYSIYIVFIFITLIN